MLQKRALSVKKSNILKTTKNLQVILKSNSKKVSLKFSFKSTELALNQTKFKMN